MHLQHLVDQRWNEWSYKNCDSSCCNHIFVVRKFYYVINIVLPIDYSIMKVVHCVFYQIIFASPPQFRNKGMIRLWRALLLDRSRIQIHPSHFTPCNTSSRLIGHDPYVARASTYWLVNLPAIHVVSVSNTYNGNGGHDSQKQQKLSLRSQKFCCFELELENLFLSFFFISHRCLSTPSIP